MQWLRLYHEVRSDPKLQMLAGRMGWSMSRAVGAWVVVLTLAAEGSQRGRLTLSNGEPLTAEDLEATTGEGDSKLWLGFMQRLGLLSVEDGVFVVPHWKERQYESDDSASRVRETRQRQVKPTAAAVTVTPEDCYNAVTVTPPDTDTETEADNRSRQQKQTAEADTEGVLLGELRSLGIADPQGTSLIAKSSVENLLAWVAFVKAQKGLKNPAAYLISQARNGARAPAVPKRTDDLGREAETARLERDKWGVVERMKQNAGLRDRVLRAPVGELEKVAAATFRDVERERKVIDAEAHETYLRFKKDPAYVEQLRADPLQSFGEREALERWDKARTGAEDVGVPL